MPELSEEAMSRIDALPTKSARIRELNAQGMSRADIARHLGIIYQHVRNVLEADKARAASRGVPAGETPAAEAPPQARTGNIDFTPLNIAPDGRLLIPAPMREAMILDKDGRVTVAVVDGELRVISPMAAIRQAQREAGKHKKPGESVVDEFLAERRALWGNE
jgi:hypothetical protein